MSFQAYADAGFADDLLPILPHDAAIHPDSPQFDSLESNKGKVPGQKRRGGWVGYSHWTDVHATPDDLSIWAGWGAGIGMQGRRFPALDIDVDDPELADAIHKEAASSLGVAPARFGRGSRRILVYAGAGLAKRRLAFRRPSGHAEALADDGARADGAHDRRGADVLGPAAGLGPAEKPQAVEFLATGQQYLVEGIHPRTGKPYVWRDGISPVEVGTAALTPVTAAQLDAFYERLEALLELYGYEIASRSAFSGGEAKVWQTQLLAPSMDALERALASVPNDVDYDLWIKLGQAVKAASGPEHEAEGYALFEAFSLQWSENTPELVMAKWQSFIPPFRAGWDFIARFATEEGDGSFYSAAEDFEPVQQAPTEEELETARSNKPLTAMFERYVWVENIARVCDLKTGALLNREQFNVRNRHIGPPTSAKECAWAVLTSNVTRLQTSQGITYRPGGEPFVTENLPGLVGRCVNVWRETLVDLPSITTETEIRTWLDHVAFVIPDKTERETVLDWLAWIIQNPGQKPNWALVIGSTMEGMGKDLMLEPVRVALGGANVREIGPEDLASGYTDFLAGTRLLLVEEMQMHERKAMMNRLKPLVAAPPYTLRVNIKFQPQYEIPNLVASIFFTNMGNALAISAQDRRYYVSWNDGQPREDGYYTALALWYAEGGAAKAARFLLDRDVSKFNAKGRAPMTEAKADMRKAARSVLEEWLEDGIADEMAPFDTDLIALADVWARMPDHVAGRSRPTMQRLAATLKKMGAADLGRVRLGKFLPTTSNDRAAIWAVRRQDMFAELDAAKVRDLYWQQREKAEAA